MRVRGAIFRLGCTSIALALGFIELVCRRRPSTAWPAFRSADYIPSETPTADEEAPDLLGGTDAGTAIPEGDRRGS